MKCRARMCDGSPVTFEHHDRGFLWAGVADGTFWTKDPEDRFTDEVLVSEFIGDGFHVVSIIPRDGGGASRLECDRLALERSGVDTATAERWVEMPPLVDRHGARLVIPTPMREGFWEPLFPPPREDLSFLEGMSEPLKQPPRSPMNVTMLSHQGLRAIINCVRAWEKADPTGCFRVRGSDLMSVGELSALADAAEANLRNMANLTRMFERGVAHPTANMLNAGAATLKDCIVTDATAINGSIWFKDPLKVVTMIWAKMEKARR